MGEFPKGGGGGSDVWEKFPNNPVIFFLSASLIYVCMAHMLADYSAHRKGAFFVALSTLCCWAWMPWQDSCLECSQLIRLLKMLIAHSLEYFWVAPSLTPIFNDRFQSTFANHTNTLCRCTQGGKTPSMSAALGPKIYWSMIESMIKTKTDGE